MQTRKINTKNTTKSRSSIKLSCCAFAIMCVLSACTFESNQNTKIEKDKQRQANQAPVAVVLNKPSNQDEQSASAEVVKHRMADAELMRVEGMAMRMKPSMAALSVAPMYQQSQQETYAHTSENGVKSVAVEPVSTFSIDVDTGSYSNVRRMLNQGLLPPVDAVRIEEFINYFDYQYTPPTSNEVPFSVQTDISVSPWDSEKHLLRIALKGYTPEIDATMGSNLVFLLDVSGSMDQPNKLPLLSRSLTLLSQQLSAKDRVSIVVYAGASGVVLAPTPGNQHAKIQQALTQLKAGGSTNGHAGIELAYQMAEQAFIKNGVNRVILATDGDFNVGIHDHDQLIEMIKRKKDAGIALTTLGFGQGNYNDHLMEQLADAGNGNYQYIDTIHEARKVLVDEMSSTLMTIAKDVKIQLEFNPTNVSEYRLIGYENRKLNQEDFNNDKVDAGEIGAGHTVTAFYEVTLVGSNNTYLDPMRYSANNKNNYQPEKTELANEIALVKLRYKPIDSEQSLLLTQTIKKQQITDFNQQSDDFRFASSVIGFAHKIKQSAYLQNMNYAQLVNMAQQAKGSDEFGYRAEFIQLLRSADSLQTKVRTSGYNQIPQITDSTVGFVKDGRFTLLNEAKAN
jgi:Ca-activated chloride channel homolog